MRITSILTKPRSIHPFFLGIFFLGAAAIYWLGPKDDDVDVESVIQDSRKLIEQAEQLQEAVSRNDRQLVATLSEQIKQDQQNKQRLQAERDAWKPKQLRVKQIGSVVFAICFILIALSYFVDGFFGQSSRDRLHSANAPSNQSKDA
jgi:hypothetical protein